MFLKIFSNISCGTGSIVGHNVAVTMCPRFARVSMKERAIKKKRSGAVGRQPDRGLNVL